MSAGKVVKSWSVRLQISDGGLERERGDQATPITALIFDLVDRCSVV